MAIKAIAWAFAQVLDPSCKLVLLALADHADDEGCCWPAIDRLVSHTSLSRSAVLRSLDALTASRHIAKVRRPNRSNTYRLGVANAGVMVTPRKCHGDTPEVSQRHLDSVMVTPKPSVTVTEPSIEPKRKRASAMSEGWQPDADLLAWAKQAHSNVDACDETDRFRDYWIAKGGTMRDWRAAFRNWIRNAAKFAARRTPVHRLDGIARQNRERINAAMARHVPEQVEPSAGGPRLRLVARSDSDHDY